MIVINGDDTMRRTLHQITSDRAAQARAFVADYFEHVVEYAENNLSGNVEMKIHDRRSLHLDALISTFVSMYPNNLLRDALLDAGVINESEYFNFSNVHVNLPADVEQKIFISFDAYSTIIDADKKKISALVFWEINTRRERYSAKKKFIDYGLDRIDFIRQGMRDRGTEVEKYIYVIVAPLDDYDKAGIKAEAEKKGIIVVFIDYDALREVLLRTFIEVLAATKNVDDWRIFVEQLEEAGIKLADVIDVHAPKTTIVVDEIEVTEAAEIPAV